MLYLSKTAPVQWERDLILLIDGETCPAAEVIAARRAGRNADPLARHFPTAADGLRGVRFIDSVLASSDQNGAWTPC